MNEQFDKIITDILMIADKKNAHTKEGSCSEADIYVPYHTHCLQQNTESFLHSVITKLLPACLQYTCGAG